MFELLLFVLDPAAPAMDKNLRVFALQCVWMDMNQHFPSVTFWLPVFLCMLPCSWKFLLLMQKHKHMVCIGKQQDCNITHTSAALLNLIQSPMLTFFSYWLFYLPQCAAPQINSVRRPGWSRPGGDALKITNLPSLASSRTLPDVPAALS